MKILIVGEEPGANLDGMDVTRVQQGDVLPGGPFDQIFLTGALERSPREQVVDLLKVYRLLLAELGELHVRVPSLEWAAKEIAVNDQPSRLAYHWLYGTQEAPHRCGFTLLWLRLALLNAGYNVRQCTQLVVQSGALTALENYALAIPGPIDEIQPALVSELEA